MVNISQAFAMNDIDRDELKCINETSDYKIMRECTEKAKSSWEAEVDKYYKTLIRELAKDDSQNLISSQKRWEKYKNSEYKLIDELLEKKHTIMSKNIAIGLKKDIIRNRAVYLKGYHELFHEN